MIIIECERITQLLLIFTTDLNENNILDLFREYRDIEWQHNTNNMYKSNNRILQNKTKRENIVFLIEDFLPIPNIGEFGTR